MIGAFYIPGVHYPNNIDLRGITPDMFEFDVKAGVNLPSSRMAEQMMYQWAFSSGIVDEEFIIENLQLPDQESLKQRMQPIWDMKREMMLQGPEQAQQPPGGLGVVPS
jgi:hypothetical protein